MKKPNTKTMIRFLLSALSGMVVVVALFAVVFSTIACSSDATMLDEEDPCDGVDCSGHGICALVGGNKAVCMCDSGYYASGDGLECLAVTPGDECKDVDCNEGGTCVVVSGDPDYPMCICGPGYHLVGTTTCEAVTCTTTPCAEPVAGLQGIAENLAVEDGIIYASYGTKIFSGSTGDVMTARYTAQNNIKGLIAVHGTLYFSTFQQLFELSPGINTASEIRSPPPNNAPIKGLRRLSFDGENLVCGSQANNDGYGTEGLSYGGTLVCFTLDGEVYKGRMSMSGFNEPVAMRFGVTFTQNYVYYSRGLAILRVPKDDIEQSWDYDSHNMVRGIMAGDLAALGDYVYWVNEDPKDPDNWALKRVSELDKSVETVVSIPEEDQLPVISLIAHDGYIYWGVSNGIWRIPADGGVPEKRAGAMLLTAMAIDDGYIYYADQATQEILRLDSL